MNVKKLFDEVPIRKVMKSPAITVFEDDNFSEAQSKFQTHRLSHLLVTNRAGKYVGLISQKYVYKTQSPRKIVYESPSYDPDLLIDGDSFYSKDVLDSYILRNIMYKSAPTLGPDDNLAQATVLMAQKKISCIPILKKNKFISGVITDQEIVTFTASLILKDLK